MNFDGKVVLVTGGARGIGKSITERFHKHGANVAILGRNAEAAKGLATELSSRGAKCVGYGCDVADGAQIDKVDNFQIFDRWGDMVFVDKDFAPNDRKHGWDGRHRGTLMTPAVFVYYAEIRLIDGRVLLFKGDVTLVR